MKKAGNFLYCFQCDDLKRDMNEKGDIDNLKDKGICKRNGKKIEDIYKKCKLGRRIE